MSAGQACPRNSTRACLQETLTAEDTQREASQEESEGEALVELQKSSHRARSTTPTTPSFPWGARHQDPEGGEAEAAACPSTVACRRPAPLAEEALPAAVEEASEER